MFTYRMERRGMRVASMGPRRFSRGCLDAAFLKVLREIALQWGRDVLVADVHGARGAGPAGRMLQWGRDVLVADVDN